MKNDKDTNLVWIDLEMTGLNLDKNRIVEIACLITNEDLEIIAEAPEIIINQPLEVFDTNNQFIVESFVESDFMNQVKSSKYDEGRAEQEILDFIKEYSNEKKSPLCGNSIYMDRMFINKYMKKLDNHLHYRLIDVSTIKALKQRWYPNIPVYEKEKAHRAMDDIKESIEELKYYKQNLFLHS